MLALSLFSAHATLRRRDEIKRTTDKTGIVGDETRKIREKNTVRGTITTSRLCEKNIKQPFVLEHPNNEKVFNEKLKTSGKQPDFL